MSSTSTCIIERVASSEWRVGLSIRSVFCYLDIISQVKRAGLSVSNNLVEGASRKTKPDKKRFFEISRSSVVEIDNCLTAIIVLKYLTEKDLTQINTALVELFKLISGLIHSNDQ